MQAPPPLHAGENAATGRLVGPDRVVFAELVQSTWNRQTFKELLPKFTNTLAAPVGGGVEPSRSDGRSPPKLELNWKHCCVATPPANIEVRSYAHTCAPTNTLVNMLKEM